MASDAARKDARERSLGGAALRLLALLALAAVVIRTRAGLAAARVGDAVGARAERVRALEHELDLLRLAAHDERGDARLQQLGRAHARLGGLPAARRPGRPPRADAARAAAEGRGDSVGKGRLAFARGAGDGEDAHRRRRGGSA